ncbi:MAG: hypothetical protein JRN05_03065 [Nitrososphaerota archaeon]|nr:hypothetical protein [Nitrososphaerota archaeon]MDG6959477.1 hypothetical protein [Nitrososphaerota archaeon]MDG6968051.1 hypothetical protein [Nitrososphaerota archaeon]MDG6969336.1 hypothetical protein [Nitrososphaerota archaeon]MDG7015291.1 hypothetical protein [Nitrososphaerota archaeon]
MTQPRGGLLSPKSRVSLGLVGGLAGCIVMGFSFVALSALGIMQFAWLPAVGGLFGGSGFAAGAALYGLGEWVAMGMAWGLIFAFGFTTYSVTKGMSVAGLAFLVMAAAFALVSTPALNGTLLSLSLSGALLALAALAIGYACWGATLGYIGKRYAE